MTLKHLLFAALVFVTSLCVAQTHYVNEGDSNLIKIIEGPYGHHGTMISYVFKDSLGDGTWVLTYGQDSTKPQIICTFKNKQRNGLYQRYDTSGNLTLNSVNEHNRVVGLTQYYYQRKPTYECFEPEDFNDIDDSNCFCRTFGEDGKWAYASRKKKRCFKHKLKLEKKRLAQSTEQPF